MEIHDFQPDLISYFPQGELLGGAFPHDLAGSFMCSYCLFPGFFQGDHVVFKGWWEHLSHGWVCPRFLSKHEGEQRGLGRVMWGRIVLEFSGRKEFQPAPRIVGTEYSKIGFDFLIGLLCLSVGLWVVGSGKFDVTFEESSKFSG